MSHIVAFIGVIGSGKDYRANELAKQGGVTRIDFKDGLIDMASDIVGYDVRQDYDWFKTHVIGVMRPSNPLSEAFCEAEWKDLHRRFPRLMTGRDLLVRLGTEAMRSRDKDYWVKQFAAEARRWFADGFDVANSDCRFMNEVQAIRQLDPKASFIFCDYRSPRYNPSLNHESEYLAQALLKQGLTDGTPILDLHFRVAAEALGEASCV